MMKREDVLNFACLTECADSCCTGATLITMDEIRLVYDVFPLTVGFRNYIPVSADHRDLLEMVGFREGNRYVVGDFVAGNRLRRICSALEGGRLCRLHREGRKPMQCRLVPFCALYPEEMQDVVLAEQKRDSFSGCRGILTGRSTDPRVWSHGRFTDPGYRSAYYGFQRGLARQRGLMGRLLDSLRQQRPYQDFLRGEGILEAAMPVSMLFDVLDAAGLSSEEYLIFIREQRRLCHGEVASGHPIPMVLKDSLTTLDHVARQYADFAGPGKSERGLSKDRAE
jgi:Fe-S-cluster containining protein